METVPVILQIVIAVGIFNVWVLRYRKPTPWRPGGATNMVEEFRRYGLPDWVRRLTGATKLSLAALLVVGIWIDPVALVAAAGLAALMGIAVAAHFQIRDPLHKALPAFSMMLLCTAVVIGHAANL